MNTLSFKLLPAPEYYGRLQKVIALAKRRVVIEAMVVLMDGRTEVFVPLLLDMLRRGVKVRIVGDIYSHFESQTASIANRGPHFSWKKTMLATEQLREAGAEVVYFGKLGINPFSGRCHTKITVIDDTVFTFGGVNFSDSHFDYRDLMLECQNTALADRLDNLVRDIQKAGKQPNLTEKLDTYSTLLFDGGTPGHSVIYKKACEIIADARKVYYVSKMCPSGVLARLLSKTEAHCYFNRPELEGLPANLAIIWDQRRFGIKNLYTGSQHVHAKIILTEGHDGSRHIISGSNNFSWRGIAFGTKEIAVHSTNPVLWQAFYDFIQQQIVAKP
jgi:cardiolipin synthase A/B